MRPFTPVVLILFFAASVLAGTAQNPPSSNDAQAAIRRLNAEEVQAFTRGDADTMARLWSDDFVVTNPLNKFVDKKQVLAMVTSGVLRIKPYERNIEYLRLYGDTAIVAGSETVVWGGRMPRAGYTEHLRFTAVWRLQDGRWQQVARHANVVPE